MQHLMKIDVKTNLGPMPPWALICHKPLQTGGLPAQTHGKVTGFNESCLSRECKLAATSHQHKGPKVSLAISTGPASFQEVLTRRYEIERLLDVLVLSFYYRRFRCGGYPTPYSDDILNFALQVRIISSAADRCSAWTGAKLNTFPYKLSLCVCMVVSMSTCVCVCVRPVDVPMCVCVVLCTCLLFGCCACSFFCFFVRANFWQHTA